MRRMRLSLFSNPTIARHSQPLSNGGTSGKTILWHSALHDASPAIAAARGVEPC